MSATVATAASASSNQLGPARPRHDTGPAGDDVQRWLALARAGKDRAAWEHLVRDNPFPAVHGRACDHSGEPACTSSAGGIHALERYLGDLALAAGWALPRPQRVSGKRVLVVGAGPGGLSAAFHLARLGHAVEVHEAGPLPGGMLQSGSLRDVLMQEVGRIEALGVKIVLDHAVADVLAEKMAGTFDAVFVVVAGADMVTGHPGVYAGGDMVPSGRTLTTALQEGKKAAEHIDAWLRARAFVAAVQHGAIGFADLRRPIYADASPSVQAEVDAAVRRGFAEVVAGLSRAEALHRTRRCVSAS